MVRRSSMASAEIDFGRLRSGTVKSGLLGSGRTIPSYSDPTKAACRAVRDALWHNSLSIATALGHPLDAMIVDVHVGVPRPEMVEFDGVGHAPMLLTPDQIAPVVAFLDAA